jgi:3'-5' exoribonuclease
MGRHYVQHLTDGETVDEVYLVSDKQMRANRNGNLYLQIELRDRTGAMSARLWNANESLFRSFDEGDLLRVRGRVQLFQGALQMILSHISPVETEKVDLADFLPHSEQDISKLLERLRQVLSRMSNHHLRALVECFLMDDQFVYAFSRAPAGVRNHHAYVGGLLEHVVTMLDVADRVLGSYPALDRDLVLMGVFLHDIGKTRELAFDRTFAYTDEGQLIGHLVIGVEMLNEKIKEASHLTGEDFPVELQLRLKHMILSHHGSHEFGSPKLPMTPEAIALHYLDNLDAKIHSFTRDIREDRNQASAWTPFNQALQRKLFKGSVDGSEPLYSPTLDGDQEG